MSEEAAALEATLAGRVGEGDRVAEADLCARLYPRIRAFARLRLREPAEAADFAQHVMLVILESLREGRVASPDRIGAFVHGVCKTTFLGWRRSERRHEALLERFGSVLAEVARLPEEAIDLDKVADCFRLLAPRSQAVVALAVLADEDAEAIARELQTTPGNVRVLRHRALKALHLCLDRGPS